MRKDISLLIKKLKRSEFDFVQNELYFIIPRLREAGKRLSYSYDPGFYTALSDRLRLYEDRITEDELCAFLRRRGADDTAVRLVKYYITLYFCTVLASGKNAVYEFRAAEKFDYGKIIYSCSPLEGALSLYGDYRISDESTRAQYRRQLSELSEKRGLSPEQTLKEIPYHKLTETLFDNKNTSAPLYIGMYVSVFITFLSLVFALSGSAVCVLLASLPLYFL